MKDGWFKSSERIEFSEDELNNQGLLDGEREDWFTNFYRKVIGNDLKNDLEEKEIEERDQIFDGDSLDEFDKIFEQVLADELDDVSAMNWLINQFHRLSKSITKIEGEFYIPLENTIHLANLYYEMENSN